MNVPLQDLWPEMMLGMWAAGWLAFFLAVPLALAVDYLLGEPPAVWHPVVWMGKALQWWGERLAPTSPVAQDVKTFWRSALIWCALAAIIFIVTWAAQQLVLLLHGLLAAALLALLWKDSRSNNIW